MDNRLFPRYIHSARTKEEIIQTLTNESFSPFYKMNNIDVIVYAAVIGQYRNLKESLGKGSDRKDAHLYIQLSDKYKSILDLIALREFDYDLDKVIDGNAVVNIFEEYSNGGMKELYELVIRGIDRDGLKELIFEISVPDQKTDKSINF